MLAAVDGIFKCQIQNKHLCFLIINGFLLNIPDLRVWSIHPKCVDFCLSLSALALGLQEGQIPTGIKGLMKTLRNRVRPDLAQHSAPYIAEKCQGRQWSIQQGRIRKVGLTLII